MQLNPTGTVSSARGVFADSDTVPSVLLPGSARSTLSVPRWEQLGSRQLWERGFCTAPARTGVLKGSSSSDWGS